MVERSRATPRYAVLNFPENPMERKQRKKNKIKVSQRHSIQSELRNGLVLLECAIRLVVVMLMEAVRESLRRIDFVHVGYFQSVEKIVDPITLREIVMYYHLISANPKLLRMTPNVHTNID